MKASLDLLTFPLRFLDFLAFEAHVRGMRKSRGVPDEEIEKYVALWRTDCAYYELALSRRQVYASGDTILLPSFVQKADYEFELGCLLEKDMEPNMSLEDAEKFFRNFCRLTILNDFSARDFQEKDRLLGLGVARSKSIMGKALGPAFIQVHELPLKEIKLKLTVNGEIRTETSYNACYWTFSKIIHHLSMQNILLDSGTLMGSGTVGGGSIAEFGGKYPWLKPGDLLEMSAEGIGILKNQIG